MVSIFHHEFYQYDAYHEDISFVNIYFDKTTGKVLYIINSGKKFHVKNIVILENEF
jgi:hypothetical protein